MVSAVSGQTAAIDLSSYKTDTEAGTQQVGAGQQSDQGKAAGELANALRPATLITLSQTARTLLQHADSSSMGRFAALPTEKAASENAQKLMQVKQIEMQLKQLDWRDDMRETNTGHLESLQASYKKVRDTPPKAAVLLNAEETKKALKMLSDAGRTPWGENYGFLKDDLQYNFKDDGTVTVQEQSVATSKAMQKEIMDSFEKSMSMFSDMLKDTSAQRKELTAQRDALLA